jgi:hypothetical protein
MAFLLAKPTPRNVNDNNDRFSMFNKERDIPEFACNLLKLLREWTPELPKWCGIREIPY